MKINYIIATWNGYRPSAQLCLSYYEQVLKNHIDAVNRYKNTISQITIMKPYCNTINSYYDINLTNNMKLIECVNEFQSYGQWLKAVEKYLNDFDYFIFVEDDYVPAIDNFDMKLIEIYEEGTYLCSMADTLNNMFPHHAAISNGIISKKTIEGLILNSNYKTWFDNSYNMSFGGLNHQLVFSDYLISNGIKIVDYRKYYMVDFLRSGNVIDFTFPDVKYREKIFTPIQNIYK